MVCVCARASVHVFVLKRANNPSMWELFSVFLFYSILLPSETSPPAGPSETLKTSKCKKKKMREDDN